MLNIKIFSGFIKNSSSNLDMRTITKISWLAEVFFLINVVNLIDSTGADLSGIW